MVGRSHGKDDLVDNIRDMYGEWSQSWCARVILNEDSENPGRVEHLPPVTAIGPYCAMISFGQPRGAASAGVPGV